MPPSRSEHVVLVLDDDPDLREIVAALLASRGLSVITADRACAAIDLAVVYRPAIALLDVRMPGRHSGLDVARRLRADERTRDAVIIAWSGYGEDPDLRREALRVGCDAYLPKSVAGEALVETLLGSCLPRAS